MQTRLLTRDDFDALMRLGREAFGPPPAGVSTPDPAGYPFPGRRSYGTFDDDGALVGRLACRDFTSWYHGTEVATSGIAGVAVGLEHRGRGVMGGLMAAAMADAREQGQPVSTLFPTAPGIYRRLGWEVVSSLEVVEVPTPALRAVRVDGATTVRRATAADVPAVRRLYATWGAAQNGPLTRTGPSFPATDEELLEAFTGITVAEHPERGVVGYAMWNRGEGYDASAMIEVEDLVTLTPGAAAALWAAFGTYASVTGKVRLQTSGEDVSRLVLPFLEWQVVERHPYMLRVDDVAAAFTGLPLESAGPLVFRVAGDPLGSADGGYRLGSSDGVTVCERVELGDGVATLSPQGLALAYAGAQPAANLRFAGHLIGGDASFDAALDGLLGRRQPHVRDYF